MKDELKKLLTEELRELWELVQALEKQKTVPYTRLPRPRFFQLAPGVTWPATTYRDGVEWNAIETTDRIQYLAYPHYIAHDLGEAVGWQPRKVMHTIRQIRAAKQWCRNRIEGREREAREILKQQKKWADMVESEIAIRALR